MMRTPFVPLSGLVAAAALGWAPALPVAASDAQASPSPHSPARLAPPSAPAATELLAADRAVFLPEQTRLIAPKGWRLLRAATGIQLSAPEGDSHIVIAVGSNADAAVAAAWAIYRPAFSAEATRSAARVPEGWDEALALRYPAAAGSERSPPRLRALRKGDRWVAVLTDISAAVADRRDAQIEVIMNSLLPHGFSRESFADRRAHALDDERVAALIAFVEQARRDYDIPGVAIGLVQDGKTIFAGGLGVRRIGGSEPVDADTLFNVASNGKAWTTLMLAKQVDAGRFSWSSRVAALWPGFRLGDEHITQKVEVRHLVCACTGMPRQDYEWLFEGDVMSADAAMTLLSIAQPTSDFGDSYQYSNLMAAAAGFFGGRMLYPRREMGRAYDDAMQRLVFDPLGMTQTTADFVRAMGGNHAAGHAHDLNGRMQVAGQGLNHAAISTRPSGNHWSNVRDMLRYVRMELDRGLLPDGRRYIGEAALLARREPQATEGFNEYYGMGLKIDRQWGVPIIRHGGYAYGYLSDMLWLPDHGVGAVILINADSGAMLRSAFRRRLLEILFDGTPKAEKDMAAHAERARAQRASRATELTRTIDAATRALLGRRYESAALGTLTVRPEGGGLTFDFGGWKAEVALRRNPGGEVVLETISPGYDGFEFYPQMRSGRKVLVIRDAQHEYEFVAVE